MHQDFTTINEKIQSFLKKEEEKSYTLADKKYKLPLSDAIFCARDTVRNRGFYKAIKTALPSVIPACLESPNTEALTPNTKPLLKALDDNCTVIDAGSGTGVLGIFALYLGADKCYFLEHNPHTLELSKKLIKYLGYEKKAHFIQCDATSYIPPEKYNLLISETITSGFIEEDFPKIVNHLKKFGKENSIIIPEAFELFYRSYSINSFRHPEPVEGSLLDSNDFNLNLQSKKGIDTKKITAKLKKDTKYECSMNVQLYKDIYLKSGECVSFANKRNFY
ncbi:methyltransferase domain-containing protein [Candidatus Peregrinibacteria bacterium]|jgi:hypothetical protein|nr:methyltransferase domain-containing protein [Candidatus Peregrinibacteria bacterium]